MSRATDFALFRLNGGGNLPMVDMTPIPLTAADTTVNGTGPWVRNPGKAGTVHIELSDTVGPSATVVVEYTNTQSAKGSVAEDTVILDAAGQGKGSTLFNGYLFLRVRCTAIGGTNASVTATLGFGG